MAYQPQTTHPCRLNSITFYHPDTITLDYKVLERSISEQGLPTAGSVRAGAHKGMGGYVRPIPGSAEHAASKRSRSRGATGMVLKVRHSGLPVISPVALAFIRLHPHFLPAVFSSTKFRKCALVLVFLLMFLRVCSNYFTREIGF